MPILHKNQDSIYPTLGHL